MQNFNYSNVLYYNKKNNKEGKMIIADNIIIAFKGIEYKINVDKLEYALSILENKKIIIRNDKQVRELLLKYKLYDEAFLKNINSIQ